MNRVIYNMELYLPQPLVNTWDCQLTRENLARWDVPSFSPVQPFKDKSIKHKHSCEKSIPPKTVVYTEFMDVASLSKSDTTKISVDNSARFFWLYYVARFGELEFLNLRSQKSVFFSHLVELIEHIQSVAKNTPTQRLACKRLLAKLSETRCDLTMETCVELCRFFGCSLAVVDNVRGVYFSTAKSDTNNKDIVTCISPSFLRDATPEIEFIDMDIFCSSVAEFYRISELQKPMRSVSAYLVADLKKIAESCHIPICDNHGKVIKKDALYNRILERLTILH